MAENMAEMEIFVVKHEGRVGAVKLGEGDVIVISSPSILHPNTWQRLQAKMAEIFPDHKCLILDGGLTLGVVSRKNVQPDHIGLPRQ